jgi:hypothetical protein
VGVGVGVAVPCGVGGAARTRRWHGELDGRTDGAELCCVLPDRTNQPACICIWCGELASWAGPRDSSSSSAPAEMGSAAVRGCFRF